MTAKTTAKAPPISAQSETFVVSCRMPQEQILSALAELPSEATRKFVVRVAGKRFVIARKQLVTNPFARSLFGVVLEGRHGSVVDYSFSIKPAVIVLFSIWFALMSVVLITGLAAIILSGASGYRIELVVLAVAFLASALSFVSICLRMSRKSEREMERILLGIIGDTIVVE